MEGCAEADVGEYYVCLLTTVKGEGVLFTVDVNTIVESVIILRYPPVQLVSRRSLRLRTSISMQRTQTQTSPSGFNLQPTHIILLRSPAIKSTLSKNAMLGFGNQYRTVDASAIAVFCTDLEPTKRIDRIFEMERQSGMREDGYLAVLRVAASFLTGESNTLSNNGGRGSSTHLSSFFKQTFTKALSPVQPMPTMENVESWSYKNAGIMAQMYTLAATAHGLSTCMMEG